MKKFLSLVMALVMTMSLVTIGAGATEYKDLTDKDEIQYEEAVAVLNKLGIISGYEDGSFRPTGALTRGAAAKIIVSLMIGPEAANALTVNTAPYSDVPVTNTFAAVISYCKTAGYINGYTDGTFRPTAALTGYAFTKMLLGALGYDGKQEGFTGEGWIMNVSRLGGAAGLFNDFATAFKGNDGVNREAACLLALNTLKATQVEYTGGTNITTSTGDATTTVNTNKVRSYKVSNNTKINKNIKIGDAVSATGNYFTLEFGEEHFQDLVLMTEGGAKDDFGRPSNRWSYKNLIIGTYAISPDYTYTAGASGDTKADKVKDMGLKDFKVTASYYTHNGEDINFTATTDRTKLEELANATANGRLIEVYLDPDNADTISDVVVVDTQMMQVNAVKSNAVSLKKVDDLQDGTDISTSFKSVKEVKEDEDGYSVLSNLKADDYVLIVPVRDGSSWVVSSAVVPQAITGSLTNIAVKSGDQKINKITVAGTEYKMSKLWTSEDDNLRASTKLSSRVETTAYLDTYGYAIYVKDVTASNSAIVIDEIYSSVVDGKIVKYAQGWDSQGNELSLNLGTSPALGGLTGYTSSEADLQGRVYEYTSASSNNAEYALVNPATSWSASATNLVYNPVTNQTVANGQYSADVVEGNGSNTLPFAADVKFIYVSSESGVGTDVTGVTVKEGVSKVTAAADLTYVLNKDRNKIVAVIVPNDLDAGNTANLLYVQKVTDHRPNADGKRVAVFTAYIKGEKVENCELSKDTANDGTFENKFYTYSLNESTGVYTLTPYTQTAKLTSVYSADTLAGGDLTGVNDYYFTSAVSGTPNLNARNAIVIDLYTDDGVNYSSVKEMKDAITDGKASQFVVSYIFNGDSGNSGYNTVSYLFITGTTFIADGTFSVAGSANVKMALAQSGLGSASVGAGLGAVAEDSTVYVQADAGYAIDTAATASNGITLTSVSGGVYSFKLTSAVSANAIVANSTSYSVPAWMNGAPTISGLTISIATTDVPAGDSRICDEAEKFLKSEGWTINSISANAGGTEFIFGATKDGSNRTFTTATTVTVTYTVTVALGDAVEFATDAAFTNPIAATGNYSGDIYVRSKTALQKVTLAGATLMAAPTAATDKPVYKITLSANVTGASAIVATNWYTATVTPGTVTVNTDEFEIALANDNIPVIVEAGATGLKVTVTVKALKDFTTNTQAAATAATVSTTGAGNVASNTLAGTDNLTSVVTAATATTTATYAIAASQSATANNTNTYTVTLGTVTGAVTVSIA